MNIVFRTFEYEIIKGGLILIDKMDMEVFLREMLMNIENEQSQIIRRLEESHREVESLQREKEIIEERLKDNISFFSPTSAKGRDRLEDIQEKILAGHTRTERIKENLSDINNKIMTMGSIIRFIHESEYSGHIETERATGVSILETQELERKRIARDLHDSTVQNLTNLVHKTEFCSKMIERDTIQVKLELMTMLENIRHTIDDMRKIIYDLRPMSIDDLGLIPTVQKLIEDNKKVYPNVNVKIGIKSEVDEMDLSSVVSLTIFRIIQEACNNMYKHANASEVYIDFQFQEDFIIVTVKDNGVGFVREELGNKDKTKSGFGLSIMQERAQLLGGILEIQSEPNEGTTIRLEVPLEL